MGRLQDSREPPISHLRPTALVWSHKWPQAGPPASRPRCLATGEKRPRTVFVDGARYGLSSHTHTHTHDWHKLIRSFRPFAKPLSSANTCCCCLERTTQLTVISPELIYCHCHCVTPRPMPSLITFNAHFHHIATRSSQSQLGPPPLRAPQTTHLLLNTLHWRHSIQQVPGA